MLKRRFGFYLLLFWFLIFSLILTLFINGIFSGIIDRNPVGWKIGFSFIFSFFEEWLAILLILKKPSLTVGKGKFYVIFAMFFIPIPILASIFNPRDSDSRRFIALSIFLLTSLAMIYSNLLTIDDDYNGAFSFLKCFKPYRLVNEGEESTSPAELDLNISDKMYPAEAHQHQSQVNIPSQPPTYYSAPPAYYSITPNTPAQPSNPFIIH